MDVWDVRVHLAEPLHVLPQWEELQVTGLPRFLMAAREGAKKLVAQVSPGQDGVLWQVYQPTPHIWLESQREGVGEPLLISSSAA